MSNVSVVTICAPPLVPDRAPIDRRHLTQMTLGEQSLEREVLELFDRQASMLIGRMRCAEGSLVGGAVAAAMAHTLKGSARGIGAWRVAEAAEAVEIAATGPKPMLAAGIERLDGAIAEARNEIAGLLRAH
jgi:HPt (histidine-containing phosphotransfer) domain-containing protein